MRLGAKRGLIFLAALAVLAFAPTLCAQETGPVAAQPGEIYGRLLDRTNETLTFDPAETVVCVVTLPPESPPFCEVVSAAWQDTFTAVVEERDPHEVFGGLRHGVTAREGVWAAVRPDGSFRVEGLPLHRRLALAARVQGLWRPFREEIWLTEEQPAAERDVRFWTLGAPSDGLRIAEHTMEANYRLPPTLRYAVVEVVETLVIENPHQRRACLPEASLRGDPFFEIPLLMAPTPTMDAAHLPALYGSEFTFLQGTDAASPGPVDRDERARGPWSFGGVDAMHGQPVQYPDGPQISLDAWHELNLDGSLEFLGEGETFFKLAPGADGRNRASLVFNRPVPPGRDGRPGRLVIKLRHRGGVLYENPTSFVELRRGFSLPCADLRVMVPEGLEASAVLLGDHRSLLAEPELGSDGMLRYAPRAGARELIPAGETWVAAIRFSKDLQHAMAELAPPPGDGQEPDHGRGGLPPDATKQGPELLMKNVYTAAAVLCGLAFLVAVVVSLRGSAKGQRGSLNRSPVSRHELVQALRALERDFESRSLPAQAYQEHRRRLMNRLLDLEVNKADKKGEKRAKGAAKA